jgi:hypothetical protein
MMKRSERYRTIASVQRYGEDLPETVLRFDPATRTVSLGESKEREEEQRISEAIVALLQSKQEPMEERDIQEALEGRKTVKVHALRNLVESGAIYRQRKFPGVENNRGNPYLYALSSHWFTSSPYISGNHGTSEKKADLTPQETLPFTGSRPSQENVISSRDSGKNQEPAIDDEAALRERYEDEL